MDNHHPQGQQPARFDDLAAEWDTPQRVARAQELARLMAADVPHPCERLLDLGCGTGLLGFELAQHVGHPVEVVGVDPSAQMRARAAERGLITSPDMTGLCPGSMDVIVSSMALHHMADVAGVLGQCALLLRPGGRLLIADLDEGQEFFHAHHHGEGEHDKVHHHGFSREAFAALLAQAGLTDISVGDGYRGHKHDPHDPESTREFTVFLACATRP